MSDRSAEDGVDGGALEFDRFFAIHYDRTRRILAVMLGDPALGEESAQEAFYRAYRHWGRVTRMDRPEAWVLVVGLNHGRDQKRRKGRERAMDQDTEPRLVDSDPTASLYLVSELVRLPPRQQQAVALRYLLDMSLQEVAAAMGCAVGSVKSTLHSALGNLRVRLTEGVET
jgi:RNA polymerase sigma-70 factor (ECF subfamily)